MHVRIEKRLVIALPVRVYGMGSDGKPFNLEAHTLDITRDGARIDGLPHIGVGETVGIQYGEEKARYKVVWASEPDAHHKCQIGVQTIQIGPAPWHKTLEATPEETRWQDPEHARDPFAGAVIRSRAATGGTVVRQNQSTCSRGHRDAREADRSRQGR